MKTVKEVSKITGISIRTLRYYDEIGLLKPTALTEANYRLYDDVALDKLQQILFFRELTIPLEDIKAIMENPVYDKEQALLTQRTLLEHKRNRLDGIIELINDVINGVNTMSFGAFSDEDVGMILDHSLAMDTTSLDLIQEKYGTIEAFRETVSRELKKNSSHFIKLFGSKEKAVSAHMREPLKEEELREIKEANDSIYRDFSRAKDTGDEKLAMECVRRLADHSKDMFHLDNARYMLLKLAESYLQKSQSQERINSDYGNRVAEYVGSSIRRFYGV